MNPDEDLVPIVDTSCIGCGICVGKADKTFEMRDVPDVGYLSVVIDGKGNTQTEIQQAIDVCPVTAIHWAKISEQVKKDLQN